LPSISMSPSKAGPPLASQIFALVIRMLLIALFLSDQRLSA
jgi:hypothetical protein